MTVPGVSVQSRQNYAQDLQLSVRGFGARSSFGVRGVRLYSDGIPGHHAGRPGPVLAIRPRLRRSHRGAARPVLGALRQLLRRRDLDIHRGWAAGLRRSMAPRDYGSFDTQRYAVKDDGRQRRVNYVVDAAHFQTDGYRVHSRAERNNINGKLRLR